MTRHFSIDRIQSAFPEHPEIVVEMLRLFAVTLERLQISFHQNFELDQLRLVTHSIKGCAAECGAPALSEIASAIEQACVSNDRASIESKTKSLDDAFHHTLREMREAASYV